MAVSLTLRWGLKAENEVIEGKDRDEVLSKLKESMNQATDEQLNGVEVNPEYKSYRRIAKDPDAPNNPWSVEVSENGVGETESFTDREKAIERFVEVIAEDGDHWDDTPNFTKFRFEMPKHDADVVVVFPGGKELIIQARPSNADEGYNGSLDIILPDDQVVINLKGDDMEPAPAADEKCNNTRVAKQLVTELPGDYD